MTTVSINRAAATPPTALPCVETKVVFHRLRTLAAECGTNNHDVVTALITACILEGRDSGPQIIGALKKMDFDHRHVAILLKRSSGTNPDRHLWRRDDEGRYSLLEVAAA